MLQDVSDSLSAALDNGDVAAAADLVERYWTQLIRTDDTLLYKAVEAIPPVIAAEHPAVILAAEVFYPLNPSVRRIGDPQIARVIETFDGLDDDQLRISRGIAAVVAMKRRGAYRAAADFGAALTAAAAQVHSPAHPRQTQGANIAAASLHVGIAALLDGRLESAQRHFAAAYRNPSAFAGHAYDAAAKLALSYALQGESHLAQLWLQHADRIRDEADSDWRFGPQERLGEDATRMLLAVDRMDWPEFHRHSRTADRHIPTEMWVFVLYARARAALFLGNQRGVIHQVQQYREEAPELFSAGSLPQILLSTAQAELWLSLGEFEQTAAMVGAFADHPLENATAARYHLLTRQPDQARDRTDPSGWPAAIDRRSRLVLLLLAVTAHLRLQSHAEERVLLMRQATIETAAEVKPWMFTFALTDPDVLDLLARHFPEAGPILAGLDDEDVRHPFAGHQAVRLTDRERMLLEQLIEDRPIAEVATRLKISASTVRNHRKNLYRKLGATSRAHAIEIARRSGLLGSPRSGPPQPKRRR